MQTVKPLYRREVTIQQTLTGWTWVEYARNFKHATSVIRAIDRDSRKITESQGSCITTINWNSITAAGAAIGRVLLNP